MYPEKAYQFNLLSALKVLVIYNSTPVSGQIKVKNWVYMVVIPWTITSYCLVDIPHIKLFTPYILTCIPTHSFAKIHDRSKHWGRSQLNPTTLVGYLCY